MMNTTGPYTPEFKFHQQQQHHQPQQPPAQHQQLNQHALSNQHRPIMVKQEIFEPRDPSPPPYLRHRDISPMPPVLATNENYDIATYRTLQVANYRQNANNDLSVKKLLFDLIRVRPHMWEKQKTKVSVKEWEKIGLEIWKRLDIIVSIEQMRLAWRIAKDGLRRRIRSAIEHFSYNPNDTEEYLQKWDVYDHFRFFRKRYAVFEEELRKQMAGQLADAAAIRSAEEDDDDIIYDGFYPGENTMDARSEGIPEAPFTGYGAQELPQPQHDQLEDDLQDVLMAQPTSTLDEPCSSKKDIKRRRVESETDTSADFLGYEIRRKLRQYPEKETLIRNSVQTLLMAFDDPEGNFQNVADVFGDIAAQEEAKAAIRARRQNRQ